MFPKLKLPGSRIIFQPQPAISWSKHIQQDHHDASKEELHDDKDGASATFSHTTPGRLVKPIEHLLKKCSANLHPNCQAPSAKFPTHIYPHYLRCFFFSSNTIMGPYLFHMGICCWQILGSLAMLVSTAFWSSENSVSKWPISRRLPYMPLMT